MNGLSTQGGATVATGQKRLRDDHGAPASKKAHIVDSEETVQVKILIPSAAVGAIIGKGGETMRNLKSESGCRLQMSKNQEVYHGTNERICLVKGKIVSVMKVVEVVMEKIREKVDPNTPSDVYDHKGVDRTKEVLAKYNIMGLGLGLGVAAMAQMRSNEPSSLQQPQSLIQAPRYDSGSAVGPNSLMDSTDRHYAAHSDINKMKLLVPNTSAGMVIGKSGARIKEIRDQTGANIQVYPKAGSQEAKVSLERVITIAAEESDVVMNAMQRVLEKVAADPQHASAIEHKELDNSFGAMHAHGASQTSNIQPFDFANRQGGGAPFGAMQQTQFAQVGAAQVWQPTQQRLLEATYGTPNKDLYSNGSGGTFKFNPMQGLGNQELLAFLDSLQSTLRTSGFNEASVAEVMQAMQVLAKYNIMGLGLGLGVAAMAQMRSNEPSSLQQPQSLIQAPRYDSGSAVGPNSLMDSTDRHYAAHSDINKPLGGVGGVLIDVMSQNKAGGGAASTGPNFASTVIKEKHVDSGHVELEVRASLVLFTKLLPPRIKEIRDQTGANIQVYPKAGSQEAKVSLERVITIAAEESDVVMNAMQRVLEKVAADPQHASAIEHKELDNSFGAMHAHGASQTSNIQPFDFANRQGGGAPFGAMQQTQFAQVGAAQVWQPTQQRLLEATYGTPNKDLYSNGSGGTFKFNPMQGLGNQEVPDAIVGAVLGPKAKTLAEIQHLSGCKVEVHIHFIVC
ncbi:RNA-binding protein Nova-1 [Toxocara canis]|uniref:RNA-binding protein Nova-1 n=1 Tax=Toxocara canis TaxID=6265 RepID=A0A0B2V1K1_TOXCA|nr:RNA-binding protein Nova-1 [Toxocara canis]